jgi:hypothetical protein
VVVHVLVVVILGKFGGPEFLSGGSEFFQILLSQTFFVTGSLPGATCGSSKPLSHCSVVLSVDMLKPELGFRKQGRDTNTIIIII